MPPTVSPDTEPTFQRLDRCATYPYAKREYLGRIAWAIVRGTLFRYSPPRCYRWRRMLLRLFGAKLGISAGVRPSVHILYPWLLELGDWTMVGDRVRLYNLGAVRIGAHTVISQGVHLCAGTHDYTKPDLPLQRPPITIGAGVWVAADAFVGPGVNIGDNSVVGACAVVTSDVPAGMVVAGNPAKVIKPREMNSVD